MSRPLLRNGPERSGKLDERREGADADDDETTEADGELKGELMDLLPQLADIRFGSQVGHDEFPDGFGVSLGLLLRNAFVAKFLLYASVSKA